MHWEKVFVDTHYLLARSNPQDQWHHEAGDAVLSIGDDARLYSTFEVLTEFLSGVSGWGSHYRHGAANRVEQILNDPAFTVIPASYPLFQKGFERYKARQDKDYSLVDCISMVVMEEEGIRAILSNDHHFEQEGFLCLIKRA
jgi:predicted nucleic acid-binding protein